MDKPNEKTDLEKSARQHSRPNDLLGGISYPLVAVEWVDSYGCASEWGDIPDKPPIVHPCYSVGWLARESEDALVIVPHISPESKEINCKENGCGDMTIPRSAVTRIFHLTISDA